LSNTELKQLAQKLVFELSRQSMSLKVSTVLNLYWHIPEDLANVTAIGATGQRKTKKRTYGSYQIEAQRVLMAILEVLGEGDGEGKIFTLPVPLIHFSEESFNAPGMSDFIGKFAEFLQNKGRAFLVFERGRQRRIYRSFTLPHKVIPSVNEPWQTRHAVIHSVTVNLPRIGYIAHGSDLHLFAKLTELIELAAEAHMQKRVFIERLLAAGRDGALGILMMKQDGKNFLQLEQADFLVGLAGLNELVQIHKGAQFHESDDAVAFGLEIISHMESVCERLSQRHHISFALCGVPNQTISSRLARLDLRYYSPDSGYVVKGDLGTGKVYYSDSIYINQDEKCPLLKRMSIEGKFSQYMTGGSMSWVPVKKNFATKKALVEFIMAVFQKTEMSQIYFTPNDSANSLNFIK
jgi:ribonucleoside-triphosphate reductase